MHDRPHLRVGILVDGLVQPAWIARVIEDIRVSGFAEVAGVVLNGTDAPRRRSLKKRLFTRRPDLLYRAYTWVDERRFRSGPDPFEEQDTSPTLKDVPLLTVRPRQTRFCDYFEEEDVARIREMRLDVALRFGFRILKGDALKIARFGVWSFHHGDNLVNRGGPPGFWEVAEDQPVTGAVLQILSEELDNGRVIYRSFSSTDRYSVWKNKRSYYAKSGSFVVRKLKDLYESGAAGVAGCESEAFTPYSSRLYREPTNVEMFRFLRRMAARHIRAKARSITSRDQWFIAYKLRTRTGASHGVPDGTLHNFKVLAPPIDRFWADPFPIVRDGKYHIFFEEYPYATGKAHISVLTLDEHGDPGPSQIALSTEFHLSYPNVFEWRGQLYMLPEAVESGSVQLYRCVEFPSRWERSHVLLDGVPGADPTLAYLNGRWWLFVTVSAPGADCWDDELHAFYADEPFGPWTAHRRNPIKSDVRSARPAGRIFQVGDRIFRPAQDCSIRYGYGISIQEILTLDESSFEEVQRSVIYPKWRPGLIATHTLNTVGDLTVIDGQWRRRTLTFGARAHAR